MLFNGHSLHTLYGKKKIYSTIKSISQKEENHSTLRQALWLFDYELLSSSQFAFQAIWTLLYYMGYLTIDRNKFLCIPNKEIEMGNYVKFQEYLSNIIIEIFLFNQAEFGYCLFIHS
ncbi:hypothetical protein GLOIN_2v1566719 [Rhizophagus clarus]|uniref:Uncharacterized protein n=1 Tax=Rhizophagus clarus TaxID=94130 RepID=A0A8H3R307_9GLOM|nr:hypothetical protein GLOIN_2v1566719 [Rhizophagus clarus]